MTLPIATYLSTTFPDLAIEVQQEKGDHLALSFASDCWSQAVAEHTSRRGRVDVTAAGVRQAEIEAAIRQRIKRAVKREYPGRWKTVTVTNRAHHHKIELVDGGVVRAPATPPAQIAASKRWESGKRRIAARVSPALYARIAASRGSQTWEAWLARAVEAVSGS